MKVNRVKEIFSVFMAAAIILASAKAAHSVSVFNGLKSRIRKDEPIRISADQIVYDKKKDIYVARGGVEIIQGDMILRADKVSLNNKTRTAIAEGNVEVIQKGDTLHGDRMEINIDTQLGKMDNGRIFFREGNVQVSGKEIVRLGENRYRVIDGTFTTCNGDVPDWRFKAKKADITVEGYAKVKGAVFEVKNFPVLYFPYFIYPAKTRRQSGFLIPSYSKSSDNGDSVTIPFFWAISDSMDATFYSKYHSKRGYQQGLEYRYALSGSNYGTSYFEYLKDQKKIDPENTSRGGFPRTDQNRWWLQLHNWYTLPLGVNNVIDVNRASDNYYLEDFAEQSEDRDLNYLKSTVSFTKGWSSYSLVTDFQYFQDLYAPKDDNSQTLQQLPRITFRRSDKAIFETPFYLQMDSSGINYWRAKGDTGQVANIIPKLSIPIDALRVIKFTPYITFDETAWRVKSENKEEEQGHRETYQYGGTLSTDLYRVFNTDSKTVQKLKHSIQPSIGYLGVPDFDQEDLPSSFVSAVQQQKLITYSLTNYMIGKVYESEKEYFYHEYIRFVLSQSYDLIEETRELSSSTDERRPFQDIVADLEIQFFPVSPRLNVPMFSESVSRISAEENVKIIPHNSLHLDIDASYNVYDQDFSSYGITMNAMDNWGDQLSIGYRVQRDPQLGLNTFEQLDGYLKKKVFESLDLFGEYKMDILSKRFIFYTFGIDLHSQCWSIRITHRTEPGIEGEPEVLETKIMLTLFGLGPVIKAGL